MNCGLVQGFGALEGFPRLYRLSYRGVLIGFRVRDRDTIRDDHVCTQRCMVATPTPKTAVTKQTQNTLQRTP